MSSLLNRIGFCSVLMVASLSAQNVLAAGPHPDDLSGLPTAPHSELATRKRMAEQFSGEPAPRGTEVRLRPVGAGAIAELSLDMSPDVTLDEFRLTEDEIPTVGTSIDEVANAPSSSDVLAPIEESGASVGAPPNADTLKSVEPVANEPVPVELSEPGAIAPIDEPAAEPADEPVDLARRLRLLSEGDALWQMGFRREAEIRYRLAKAPFDADDFGEVLPPMTDPEALSPEGRVYWREAEAGRSQNLRTRMETPLRLLTQQYPEFVPGHLRYAEVLAEGDRPDEALAVLERAVGLYPDSPELVRARVAALAENGQLVEAAIAARQFALMHPNDPAAAEFEALAEQHTEAFRNRLERNLRGGAIANLLTGALGFALTGNLFGPISSVQTGIALLRGEENVGEAIARRAARQLPLIQDEAVNTYVNEMGQRLAAMTGRSEFAYEFFIIRDRNLNAFALPGGKIFINAGAILKAESEAELAGLIAHELAHTSLSHGFQLAVDANTLGNAFQLIPYGGYAANLLYFNYSRDMERQADAFGTRLLASAGYAADGLHGLMVTLAKQERQVAPFEWLSTHPDTAERQRNIERQIRQNGYNRYAYEGVDRHAAMRQRVQVELGMARLKKPTAEPRSHR